MSISIPGVPFPGEPYPQGSYPQGTDIYSQLYQRRIIFVAKDLDDEFANQIIAAMLYLDADDPGTDIHLYINSSGGSLTAGLAVYDAMQCLRSDVVTVCGGLAAMMGAFLLAVGTPGKRAALPHARIRLQQPSITGPQTGPATEIEIMAKELLRLRQRLQEIYAQVSGQAIAKIRQDTERDVFLSAPEAQAYGLIDQVLSP